MPKSARFVQSVSLQHWLVTDGRTDEHTTTANTALASIASRVNNPYPFRYNLLKVMRSVMSVRPCLCTLVQNMFIPGNGSVHSARTVIRELQFRSVHVL